MGKEDILTGEMRLKLLRLQCDGLWKENLALKTENSDLKSELLEANEKIQVLFYAINKLHEGKK